MRKMLVLFMCCLMVFSAVSCQSNKKPDQSQGGGGSQLPDKPNDGSDEQQAYFSISTETCSGGTIKVDKEQAKEGEKVTVTLSANSNFRAQKLTLSYGDTTLELSWSGGVATFEMPASDVSVSAEFVQEAREVVDYMILGDSYTDFAIWADFYSDMRDLPSAKTIGVGGTKVPHWGKTGTEFKNTTVNPGGLDDQVIKWDGTPITTEVMQNYYVNNFVFHLGVNDIDAGISADTVISDLKTLFGQYREEYPNANIYWISLSLNSMYPQYIQTYKKVNAAIERYAEECEYLTYINTVDTMFPDGKPNADWFYDGLHFNADGYATWSSLITEALGFTRADVDVFGSAGNYYSSNTWEYDPATQTVSNETLGVYSEQSLWFDGVYAVDMYAEMEITVNAVKNNDQWPKFGMAVKGNGNHAFFCVEPFANLTGNNVNYTERRPRMGVNNGLNCEGSVWDWTIQGNNWTAVPSLSYANGNYAKLALLRCGADMYFFVNDQLVFTKGGFVGCDEEMAIGLTLINLDVTVKNYSVTTDVKDIIEKFDIKNAPNAHYQGNYSDAITNASQNGGIMKNVADFLADKFYFETEITLDGALNIPDTTEQDKYPKAGICLESEGNSLLFYIDAVNTGAFGSNKVVGVVHRENGGDWKWNEAISISIPSLEYTNSAYVKMAIYKDGERIVFLVNDTPVLDTTKYQGLSYKTTVGFMEYNLAFKVRNSKIATSETILNLIDENIGLDYDVNIDGDLSDWSSEVKTNYYGKSATDSSGRAFKVYSFMGKNAVYVGYEIVSTTYTNNTAEWWLSTNAEMRAKNNNNNHIYVSANGQSSNVLCYSVKSSQDPTTQLYTTYIEIAISYFALGATPEDEFVNIMFAARPGNEEGEGMCLGANGVWWCGDYNPESDSIPFNITPNGIDANIN